MMPSAFKASVREGGPINKTNIKVIFALTLVHFTGDFYSSFTIPLIPEFVEKYSLSMAQVGIIMGIIRLLAFIVQPSVGYLADHYSTRVFALGGLLLTVLFIPLSGIAPSYVLLTVCLAIGSLGSSMFHPSVTGMVPLYGGRNAGFSMSVFNTGGTLAFSLGPVFIAWFVVSFGLSAMPLTMLIGLAALFYLFYTVPVPQSEGFRYLGFIGSIKETLGEVWKPLVLIWIIMVIRAAIGQSFLTFIPVLLSQRGHSLVSIGLITSIFIIAGTVSGLAAGFLSDRIEFKKIFYVAHSLMFPALLFFLRSTGNWVYAGAALSGFFVLATLPIGVVMAQTLAPRGRSMVASLMMGFAYGLGGALTPITGKLADLYSIPAVLFYVSFVPLATIGLIHFLPNTKSKNRLG
jgi:FSR family fosmidomycin resistance protein-like MFS transporter